MGRVVTYRRGLICGGMKIINWVGRLAEKAPMFYFLRLKSSELFDFSSVFWQSHMAIVDTCVEVISMSGYDMFENDYKVS